MKKTVLITGATSGIGKATAQILAKNNFKIILCGRLPNEKYQLRSSTMSHLLQQFFSSQKDANPIDHIHRLETTTLFDDKLSSVSKLVGLSVNRDYDYFFLRGEDENAGINGLALSSQSSSQNSGEGSNASTSSIGQKDEKRITSCK